MSRQLAEADRQIGNLLNLGVVESVDGATGRVRVRIGEVVTPPIPAGQMRAGGVSLWWMPEVGEQVMIGAPSGDLAQAVILSSVFAGNAPSSDAGVPMIELAGGSMKINGSLEITGSITLTGGDVTADGVSLKTHTHRGVTPGGGNTGEPN